MDPTACLNRIMELQAELTELGEQYSVHKLRNSGHPTYEEWVEAWNNLMDWLIKGGFAPTLDSLEPAGKVKRSVHAPWGMTKSVWVERDYLYSDRGAPLNRQCSIYCDESGKHVLHIYGPGGNLVGSWNLPRS